MYEAIVALPLIGAIIAGAISLFGARNRFPGEDPPPPHDDHAAAPVDESHVHGAPSPHAAHAVIGASHSEEHASEPAAAGSRVAELITTTLLIISCVLSWYGAYEVGIAGHEARIRLFSFISFADLHSDWALRIDALTVVMLVVVTTISSLVHLYSIGYMSDDPYRPRFFCYLSFFTFAMLMLVTADNLVQLFFGWEGVGLASYLLIGFWYYKPEANAAAIKAFVVNRVGDFGFLLGIFAVFALTGAVDFDTIFAQAPCARRQELSFPELERRRADHRLSAPVHGRDGQVGAVPAAHLAAGRDGRPDAGVGADPRRHHGDGRRVHGGAAVAAVLAVARRAGVRHLHRRHDLHCSPPRSGWCRTTSSASSRIRPVRSSATCSSPWASAPIRSACFTCSRTPSSRRCCFSAPAR